LHAAGEHTDSAKFVDVAAALGRLAPAAHVEHIVDRLAVGLAGVE